MTKPQTYQTSAGNGPEDKPRRERKQEGPEPLSGSKKVKTQNHVSHNNPEG